MHIRRWSQSSARAGAGARQGPCGFWREGSKWTPAWKCMAWAGNRVSWASVCTSPPVIPRVRQMRSTVGWVIYRAAQDPNSLNVAHELVFQTFRNELWHTTLKIQLPQQDIQHKSKISTAWRCIRARPQRGSDSPKVILQMMGQLRNSQCTTFAQIGMGRGKEHLPFQLMASKKPWPGN